VAQVHKVHNRPTPSTPLTQHDHTNTLPCRATHTTRLTLPHPPSPTSALPIPCPSPYCFSRPLPHPLMAAECIRRRHPMHTRTVRPQPVSRSSKSPSPAVSVLLFFISNNDYVCRCSDAHSRNPVFSTHSIRYERGNVFVMQAHDIPT
jgi:hypothetical protein